MTEKCVRVSDYDGFVAITIIKSGFADRLIKVTEDGSEDLDLTYITYDEAVVLLRDKGYDLDISIFKTREDFGETESKNPDAESLKEE